MISIVIPLYNKEKQISETLESVFRQTFQDFEVVIVNDGSSDNSVEVVKKFEDKRISIISQLNQGVSAARNNGTKNAKYDYIALLDADDEWYPDYLQEQVDLINNYPECSIFACAYEFRNGKGEVRPLILNKMPFTTRTGVLTNYFEVASCSHPPICSINIVAKKEIFLNIGGFPVGVKSGEDLLTWARLATKYQIAYNRNSLAIFNTPDNVNCREPRLDIHKDAVFDELLKLYNENEKRKDIKKYIARWNEMRASIFIQSGNRLKAFNPLFRIIKYGGNSKKALYFFMLIVSPAYFQNYIEKIKEKWY